MWAIWDFDAEDWLCEPAQEYTAILCFRTKREACGRAALCWGYDSYSAAKRDGWCEVVKIASPARRPAPASKVVRKRGA